MFFVLAGGYCDDGSEFELYTENWTGLGEAPRCPQCGEFTGMLPLLPPIRGVLEAEKCFCDLTKVIGGADILLSARCWQVFEREGIRGLINPTPVEILNARGTVGPCPSDNYLLAGTQTGATVDRVASALRTSETEPCPVCGSAGIVESYDRVAVDAGSWLGVGLFTLKGLPGPVLVTARVRDVCKQAGLKVCRLIPAEQYSM